MTRSRIACNIACRILEPGQIGMRESPVAHVHPAVLRAPCECWNRLAGIEQPVRIECLLHRKEHCTLLRRELHAHGVDLLDANTMLAGDGAAQLHAQLEDCGAEAVRLVPFARAVGIEEDEGMEVP